MPTPLASRTRGWLTVFALSLALAGVAWAGARVAGVQGALALLCLAVLAAGALWLAARTRVWGPLAALTGVMRRAAEGEWLVRADPRAPGAVGAAGEAFNAVLARLTEMKAEEIDNLRDLAAARERLELQAALEARAHELGLLYEVARALSATLDMDEVLKRIAELVPARLGIPAFSIMLVNAEGALQVHSALPRGPEGVTFRAGEGACGRALATRAVVHVPDLGAADGPFLPRADARRPDAPPERGALLCVPMRHQRDVLGVLNLQRTLPFTDADVQLLTAVADLAAAAVKNARLHAETVALSLTDPLTGVANRRELMARLDQELARASRFGQQVSLLMIDVDHFRHLNETLGHRAADATLGEVAALLSGLVRRVDTLGRYGGEEFLLVLTQVSKQAAVEVAEKLRRAVAEAPLANAANQPGGRVTISVGVASYPADAVDLERLLDCADSSLYASKRAGRDCVTPFAPGMENHPGRERGPHARAARRLSAEA